ncbi:hypothetical protein [Acidianus sp. RZ1]|uniref:hypothetical protein n=1 Tax=Acidianus sp. RZ1 TaxID=1540082 RepID=UPI001492530D|nr:hypothetical protein [Acidianus sp. RZ1]NON61655.1 hypothetical protein [Acidianus sp. RZ1]
MKWIFLLVLLLPLPAYGGNILLHYPRSVLYGEKFSISFQVFTNEIQGTDFQYITPGVIISSNESHLTLTGNPGDFAVFKTNVSSLTARELVISFSGDIPTLGGNPGPILYEGIDPHASDISQSNFYAVLVSMTGILWVHNYTGWHSVLGGLPSVKEGNYSAVFKDVNGYTCVPYVVVNGSKYVVDYLTDIPWNFSFAGFRVDINTVIFNDFNVISTENVPFVVFINGREAISGNTTFGEGEIHLTALGNMVVNITFPTLHEYRVIDVGVRSNEVKEVMPTIPLVLIAISAIIIGIGIWRNRGIGKQREK